MNKDFIDLKKELINIDITINSLETQLDDYKNKKLLITNKLKNLENTMFNYENYKLECLKYIYNNLHILNNYQIKELKIDNTNSLNFYIKNIDNYDNIIEFAHKIHCKNKNMKYEEEYTIFNMSNFSIYLE